MYVCVYLCVKMSIIMLVFNKIKTLNLKVIFKLCAQILGIRNYTSTNIITVLWAPFYLIRNSFYE